MMTKEALFLYISYCSDTRKGSSGNIVTLCGIEEQIRFVVVVIILSSPPILLAVNYRCAKLIAPYDVVLSLKVGAGVYPTSYPYVTE